MITRIRTHLVYVTDPAQAVRFYTGVLGCTEMRRTAITPAGDGVEVAPPGGPPHIVLLPRGTAGAPAPRLPAVVFACEDIERTYQALLRQGVTFTQQPTPMPAGWVATFTDPDGNAFALLEGP